MVPLMDIVTDSAMEIEVAVHSQTIWLPEIAMMVPLMDRAMKGSEFAFCEFAHKLTGSLTPNGIARRQNREIVADVAHHALT